MKRNMDQSGKAIFIKIFLSAAFIFTWASAAFSAPVAPVLWSAGGLDAGNTGAGQASRIAVDTAGNVAVVSGPAFATRLAVTSYTAAGALRWQRSISPASGTFVGYWIAAAPNGDFVAMGYTQNSSGNISGASVVRYAADGTFQWRVDSQGTLLSIGRLNVDASGNSYFVFNSILYKYSPAGALLWSISTQVPNGGAALSPDGADIVLTGSSGGNWRTTAIDTATGTPRWLVVAPEGISANDLVIDNGRAYITGQGYTGAGTPQLAYFLTVVAYDQATGARLWRSDKRATGSSSSAGLWIVKAPDGSLVVAGQANLGFLDWYTVAFATTGAVRWEAIRNGGLNTDEVPRGIRVLADGTAVVTGVGGPALPGGFIQGITAGYGPAGTLLWEGFSRQATVWLTALPSGDVCTSGGYDALITCFDVPGVFTPIEPVAIFSTNTVSGQAPLAVAFDGSASNGPNTLSAWNWAFGDGIQGSGAQALHTYSAPGTYTASLTVTDVLGLTSLPRFATISVSAPPVPMPPAAPANFDALPISGSSVGLSWANGAEPATEIRIERCKGSTCTKFSTIATVPGSAISFSDTGLATNTYYRYRARAFNSAGKSPYSNVATVKTLRR